MCSSLTFNGEVSKSRVFSFVGTMMCELDVSDPKVSNTFTAFDALDRKFILNGVIVVEIGFACAV